ncbi:Pentatricopeptide repeat-containing protein At1g09900 [Durusdinium trenchii]|uniref:Pentatricopeptide repeat-containing protein At1g09900 n=1 Tax=Durusdinium trenchii TaxID=1381693 RepID=A0ABP0JMU7_9DINO
MQAVASTESAAHWISRVQQIARHGRWEEVLRYLANKPYEVALEVVYSIAIVACGRSSRWEWALRLLHKLQKTTETNVVVVGSTMGAFRKAGRWELASLLLGLQCRVQLNTVVYNEAIASFAGMWQQAGLLLDKVQNGWEADVISYTALLSEKMQWDRAFALLHSMSHALWIQADTILYNAAIAPSVKARRWEETLTLVKEIQKQALQPDEFSFNMASTACEKTRWQHAQQCVRCLRNANRVGSISFSVALKACSWTACCEMLQELCHVTVQADLMLYNIAMTQVSANWETALVLLQSIHRQLQADTVSFNSAINACGKRVTCWAHAQHLLQDLNTHLRAELVSYTSVIDVYKDLTRWPGAVVLWEELQTRNLKTDITCASAVSVLDWRLAVLSLYISERRSIKSDSIAYNDCMSTYSTKEETWQHAEELLARMGTLNVQINTITLNTALHKQSKWQWQKVQLCIAKLEESDLVTLSEASVLFDRAGEQLQAASSLGSLATTCQSELKQKGSEGKQEFAIEAIIEVNRSCTVSQIPHAPLHFCSSGLAMSHYRT